MSLEVPAGQVRGTQRDSGWVGESREAGGQELPGGLGLASCWSMEVEGMEVGCGVGGGQDWA